MTSIGLPHMPTAKADGEDSAIRFTAGHHFSLRPGADVSQLAEAAAAPLSVILQVTKRCDFDCTFCSETMQMKDPTLARLPP